MAEEEEWFTSPARVVRYEPVFTEQIEQLGVQSERLDDAIAGLEAALSKHPEIFPRVPDSPFSIAHLRVYTDAPTLRVWFTYDPTTVKVHYIDFSD